jgi:hypothetical protein
MRAMSLGSAPGRGNPRPTISRAAVVLRPLPEPARLFRSPLHTRTPWSQPPMRTLQTTPRPLRTCLRGALSIVLLALPLRAFAAGSPASAQKAAPATPKPAAKAPAAPKPVHPLPDSVLMRIDDREDVTVRRFKRAVRLLGGNPDSLTPADRDRFLDLVLEQRVLAAHAVKAGLPWVPADSSRYRFERDNTLLRAALSDRLTAVEDRRRAAGQPDLDEEALGKAARESLMTELKPVYDDAVVRKVGSAFAELPQPSDTMSTATQMKILGRVPEVAPADSQRVLARSSAGEYRVSDLLQDYRRLSPIYRPRIKDADGVRDMVENGLFERTVRKAAADPALAERAEVAAVLADRVEYHAVNSYLQQAVVMKIPTDSLTLKRYYKAHARDFDQPARNVLVTLMIADSVAAESLARVFAYAGNAESLAFQAQRAGTNYTQMVTAASDSALYARTLAIGAGGVGGPDRIGGAFRIFKVLSVEPKKAQPFADVRDAVHQAWLEAESERRIRALLDQLKAAARVQRNDAALRAIVLSTPPKHG